MKLTGNEVLRALDKYFSQSNYEAEVIIMLLFPALLLAILMFFLTRNSSRNKDPFGEIPAKDLDFIETVRLQKGLEEFDRDFLINLAMNNGIRPIYQLFIDISIFEAAVNTLKNELLNKNENPAKNKTIQHLENLKKKLY